MKQTACSLTVLALSLPGLAAVADAPHTAGYHLVRSISMPGEGGWDYLSVDSHARRLYISRGTHVTVVDVDKGAVAGDIPGTDGVHGIAIDPKNGHGFTSNGRANAVTIFDTKSLRKIGEVPVDTGPDCIIFDPATERVFTFNGRAQSVTAIDAKTGKVVGTIPLPGRPEFAAADGMGHIYDNIEDKSEVVAIESKTLKVDHVWPIAPGEGPSGLAVDANGRRIFSVCDNQKMVILNADTGDVVATPVIGNGPDAVAFDPGTDLIFSPNGEDGTMTIVHEAGPAQYETVATITTQAGARTMALDAKTHHVFTVTAQALPPPPAAPGVPAAPRWRRSYAPGTFVVLEYAP